MAYPSGYREVESVIRASEFGKKLSHEARYDKYRHPSVSIEEWGKLLGRDVNNLEHMPLTRGIALAFIRHTKTHQPELLDQDDEFVIPVAASLHDVPEAITVDKSFSDKTNDDEIEEAAVFDLILPSLYPNGYPPFVDEVKDVIFDHEGATKRGRIFNTIEHLGYMRTAMNAMDLVVSGESPELQIPGLQWLYTDVLTNAALKLVVASKEFDAVRVALIQNVDHIEQAFELVGSHPEVFDNYPEIDENGEKKRDKKVVDFLLALDAWHQFKDDLSLGLAS